MEPEVSDAVEGADRPVDTLVREEGEVREMRHRAVVHRPLASRERHAGADGGSSGGGSPPGPPMLLGAGVQGRETAGEADQGQQRGLVDRVSADGCGR